jgi:DNA-packaging protein gp3
MKPKRGHRKISHKSRTKRRIAPPKRKVGRPTKYTPEVLEVMGAKLLRWFGAKKNLWLKDFAHQNGMHWSQLSELAEKSEEFSHALKTAKEMQEAKLFRAGLSKKYNASMAIFALKNVAGWRDKQEVDYTGAFSVNIAAARSSELKEDVAQLLKDENVRRELADILKGSPKSASGKGS